MQYILTMTFPFFNSHQVLPTSLPNQLPISVSKCWKIISSQQQVAVVAKVVPLVSSLNWSCLLNLCAISHEYLDKDAYLSLIKFILELSSK